MPAPNTQLAKVCSSPKELLQILETSKSAIANALPKHLNPDRMLRLALTAFSTTPALRNCTGQSILAAIVVASQLGLEPGVRGQAYLIPYKDTCTLVPGWIGLVGLLNNSGRATAWTGAVFDGDRFDISIGSSPHINHEPGPNAGEEEKLIGAYACGRVNGAEVPVIEYWTIDRIKRHRDKFNKVGARHYSFQHIEMYARKVVLLQVLKYMPSSIELSNAIVASDSVERGGSSRVEDGIVIEVPPESVAEGNVGKSIPIEDAAAAEKKPAKKQEPVPPPEEAPLAVEPEKDDGRPTLAENRAFIVKELNLLNIGRSRFVDSLVENEIIPQKVSFDDLSVETLQEVIDVWSEYKPKVLSQ